MQVLSNSIQIVHCLLKEVLSDAQIIVDATAGNGYDTLFLAQNASTKTHIYAFDIQKQAIFNAKEMILNNEHSLKIPLNNIQFINDSHERIDEYVSDFIDVAIFNLGYLPGGNHEYTTKNDITMKTLQRFINKLKINGHLAIVMYPGHEEGLKEYQAIELWAKDLMKKSFTVGWYKMVNHNFNAPTLCWIEKVGE